MNKSALKNFAIQARKELKEKITIKALQLGITEENIKKESVQSSDAVFIEGKQLNIEEKIQRNKLIDEIKLNGFNQVIEEVAYTWFNRFTALRFMEVNNYLPTKVRVLSSENEGSYEPDIIKEALNINLDIDKELVFKLKMSKENDSLDKLYKYLIIKQCNALNDILPILFEKILDYTELLFPNGILSDGSFLRMMTDPKNIAEKNWENVEVIGWLYQYYISERKDEVFAGLKINKKIGKDDIAPATQLFTPHWIVRYMVENSVGKLWQEGHPNEELKKNWTYYIVEAEQEEVVQKELEKIKVESKKLKVEDLKIIDPAMGSGHILVYAFDLLYDIYLSEGYIAHEIPRLIIEKNLYGLDIDERAFQLAYFALMMKGRSKSRRFFNEPIEVNICAIEESNDFPKDAIKYFCNSKTIQLEKHMIENDLEYLINIFIDAKEYGSILKVNKINFNLIEKRLEEIRSEAPEDIFELRYRSKILDLLPNLIKQGKIMSDKYDVIVTNPPYMGSKGMNYKLSEFVNREYPDTKADLFAVFISRSWQMAKCNGFVSFITMQSWMFLSSYEKLRLNLITKQITSLIQIGFNSFPELNSQIAHAVSFVIRNCTTNNYIGKYFNLNTNKTNDDKNSIFLSRYRNSEYYLNNSSEFLKIPSYNIAYWLTKNEKNVIINSEILGDKIKIRQGLATGDNAFFLKSWYEVNYKLIGFQYKNIIEFHNSKSRYAPYNKSGDFRKWYGNNDSIIKFDSQHFNELLKVGNHLPSREFYFKKGITWSLISTNNFASRISNGGYVFDVGGSSGFPDQEWLYYYLGLLCSRVTYNFLRVFNPTINFQVGDVKNIPIINSVIQKQKIDTLVVENISISKTDWDLFETSWDFKRHCLLNGQLTIDKQQIKSKHYTLQKSFEIMKEFSNNQFNLLKSNEEELNRIFIDVYGLQNEITPVVEDRYITISKADRERDIKSFISYAVGCMFGRYSLDEEGLIYAGGDFDYSKYENFPADKDNVIPILSDSYFEEDMENRLVDFVKITFGKDTLNGNLKYIAESIGVRGNETPRETIRRYLLNDFYKNHIQIYKKRPIYWLFTSGKEKAFNALIYMHRYDSSTLARIRTDYLHVLQSRLAVERLTLLDKIKEIENAREKNQHEKELKDLDKKIAELKAYDEVLHNMADRKIEIDLDDGVVANYEKFKGLVHKI